MKLRRVVALVVAWTTIACGGGSGGGGGGGGGNGTGWTVLVYVVADNNLEPFAVQNLQQMAQVGSGNGLNIAVQVDRAGQYSTDPIGNIPAPRQGTTKRLLVQRNGFQDVTPAGMTETDMGNPDTLRDFIEWGVKTYPAGRYALVLWDHGGDWLGGFGADASFNNSKLLVDSLSKGVHDGLQRAGLARFSIVGFDACLMASFEVAEGLKGTADYLLVSEEVEPGAGWDYGALATAQGNANVDPVTLGRAIADGYKAFNAREATLTLSLLDMGQLGALESAVRTIDEQLSSAVVSQAGRIGQSRERTLEFGKQQDRSKSFNQVDLGDLWTKLGAAGGAWATAQQQVQAALAKLVVYQVAGQARAGATGITVYFPPSGDVYDAQNPQAYEALAGIQSWRNFLKAYLRSGASLGAPTFANHTATVTGSASQGWTVTAPLTAGSAAATSTATLTYGYYLASGGVNDASHLELFGDQPASFDAASVSGAWDGSILQLTQDGQTQVAYLSLEAEGQLAVAVIPLAYFAPGETSCSGAQTAIWQITIDTVSNTIQSDRYYLLLPGNTIGELRPTPGTTFEALFLYADANGSFYSCSGRQLDATRPIGLDFYTPTASELAQAGASLYSRLDIANAGGKGDVAVATWTPSP